MLDVKTEGEGRSVERVGAEKDEEEFMQTKVKARAGVMAGLLMGIMMGVVAGAAGTRMVEIRGVQAQDEKAAPGASSAPGYVIAEVQVSDMDLMKQYGAKAPGIIAQYGGKYIIRGGRVVTEEGEPTKGLVVLQFGSFEKAKEWYESPEYSAIRPIRQKAAKSRLIIEEGVKE